MCTAPRGNHSTLDGVAQFVQTALLTRVVWKYEKKTRCRAAELLLYSTDKHKRLYSDATPLKSPTF